MKWQDKYGKQQLPLVKNNQLDNWLKLPVNDRAEIALAFMDALMVIVDTLVDNDQYMQIGTTQNKSSFVLAIKGGASPGHAIYNSEFISVVAQLAGEADFNQELKEATF